MTDWVRTHIHFGLRLARFVVVREEWVLYDRIGSELEQAAQATGQENPVDLEQVLLRIVLGCRPDLSGGMLVAFRFDLEYACWEFIYSHPSLLPTGAGELLRRYPLVPDETAPLVAKEGGAS